jgi:hypothetical protein
MLSFLWRRRADLARRRTSLRLEALEDRLAPAIAGTLNVAGGNRLLLTISAGDAVTLSGSPGSLTFTATNPTDTIEALSAAQAAPFSFSASANANTGNATTIAEVDVSSANGSFNINTGATALTFAIHAAPGVVTNLPGDVNTPGFTQSYDRVNLLAPATLAGTAVTFGNTVDGAFDLTVVGNATFANAVGSLAPLNSLVVTGSTAIDTASITTTVDQNYNGAVTLNAGGNVTITSTQVGSLAFASTLTGDGTHGLVVAGNPTFANTVHALSTLTVQGISSLNGGNITTSGDQTYQGAVALEADTTLTSTGGAIAFHDMVDGGQSLTVVAQTQASFDNHVGRNAPLASLNVTAPAIIDQSAASASVIATSGAQSYTGAFIDGVAAANSGLGLITSDSTVTFSSTVNGANAGADDLSVQNVGLGVATVTFNGRVGHTTPLGKLDVHTNCVLNGGSVTSVEQSYDRQVSLGANTVLTAQGGGSRSNLSFGSDSSIHGSVFSLVALADATITLPSVQVRQLFAEGGITQAGARVIQFQGTAVMVQADDQVYQGGSGAADTAAVDLVTNSPIFTSTAGGAPVHFALRQDAVVSDAAIPTPNQFPAPNGEPIDFFLISDGGSLTVSPSSNLANPNPNTTLFLSSSGPLNLSAAIPYATVLLQSTHSNVMQTGGSISATNVGVRAGGNAILSGGVNDVTGAFAASVSGNLDFQNDAGFSVASVGPSMGPAIPAGFPALPTFPQVNGVGGGSGPANFVALDVALTSTTHTDLTLNQGISATQVGLINTDAGNSAGTISQTGGQITATTLGVIAAGTINLMSPNAVGTSGATPAPGRFAARLTGNAGSGDLVFVDTLGLTVTTVGPFGRFSAAISGIDASNGGNIHLSTGSAFSLPAGSQIHTGGMITLDIGQGGTGTAQVNGDLVTGGTAVQVNGGSGDNTLTVDFTTATLAASGLRFLGSGSPHANRLVVRNLAAFATVTDNLAAAGTGSIQFAAATSIFYTGLSPVAMTGTAAGNLVFNLPLINNQALVADDGVAGNNLSQLRSQNANPTFETTTFVTPTRSLTLNMGDGTLTVAALDSAFNAALNVNGQAGNDTMVIQAKTGPDIYTIAGGPGTNTLVGPNANQTWNITGSNAGNLGGAANIAFSNIQNLTGGTGADVFILGDGVGITGVLTGGGGTDTLDYSAYTRAVSVNFTAGTATGTGGIAGIPRALQAAVQVLISAPVQVRPSQPWTVTATARDSLNNPVTGGRYRGTIHFASSDGSARLPANYTFTALDAGTHAFPNAVAINTPGEQTVTASDIANTAVSGSAMVDACGPQPGQTPNQRFLAQVYCDFFDREVDVVGLAAWGSLLDQGVPRTQIVTMIEGSLEYRSNVVQALYQKFLHRAADAFGLNAFTMFLGNGGTAEQVEAVMVGSPEYFQLHGSTTAAFLSALYQDVLQRPVDAVGAQAWGAELASGVARGTVAAAILASMESDADQVQSLYQQFLHRPADPTGLTAFGTALQQGVAREVVLAEIGGSAEYFGLAQ